MPLHRRQFLKNASALAVPCPLLTSGVPLLAQAKAEQATNGPLAVHPRNRRYFVDQSGNAVCLTGSHLGWELQDNAWDKFVTFDFDEYLNRLARHGHNVIRLWMVEHTRTSRPEVKSVASPMPFRRTGPGRALDGELKFDLDRFNPDYFGRLKTRVELARSRGIYVVVMLFQGWSLRSNDQFRPWFGHYFNAQNNINDIDGDPNGDDSGHIVHSLENPGITRIQESYVRRVVESVGQSDNVLFEVANESLGSLEWHEHMASFVTSCMRHTDRNRPVLISGCRRGLSNETLFGSSQVCLGVSRDANHPYATNPPAADGRRIIIADSDHIEPRTKNPEFVWKNFFRGNHPWVLDWGLLDLTDKSWEPIRVALGRIHKVTEHIDLADYEPRSDLVSTDYCLASRKGDLFAYLPNSGQIRVDLTKFPGSFSVHWIDAQTERESSGPAVDGAAIRSFQSPFNSPSILHLSLAD